MPYALGTFIRTNVYDAMHEILQNKPCFYSPRLRSDLLLLCDGDMIAALVMDYYCYGRHMSEMCSVQHYWPSTEYMRIPHFLSIRPSFVANKVGNVLTEQQVRSANELLLGKKYLTIDPEDKERGSLNAGYVTIKYREMEPSHANK